MKTSIKGSDIYELINNSVKTFIETIHSKHSLDSALLNTYWKESSVKLDKIFSKKQKEQSTDTTTVVKQQVETETKTLNLSCPHMFTRGAKQGQRCGVKSKNGEEYCSTHRKKDSLKRSSTSSTGSSSTSSDGVILKRYGHDNKHLIHMETQLIFDRSTKKVIGKLADNKITPLSSEEDKELCNKWRFKMTDKPVEPELDQSSIEATSQAVNSILGF